MTVQSTSLEAYLRIQEEGIPDTQREMIMMLFRFSNEPMTNREIAKALGMEPSTVSARRNELITDGKLHKAGKRKCRESDYTAYTWEATQDG